MNSERNAESRSKVFFTTFLSIVLCYYSIFMYCLFLLSSQKEKGAHMKASYICSSTDVMANAGVIIAGVLVSLTHSGIPDLVISTIVAVIVLRGANSILKIADY